MSHIIQPLQQPMVYPTWEVWLGVVSAGVLISTLVPEIGGKVVHPHGVPVIRDFCTTRFAARTTQTVAGPPAGWNAILYKNGVVAAYAVNIIWGVAPAVVQTTRGWADITGVTPIRTDYKRGDYWSIEMGGVSLVTAPSVICMMDFWGKMQVAGGPGG